MYYYDPKIKEILEKGDFNEIRELFAITDKNVELMASKFNLWAKSFYPKSFNVEDAPFHYEMNQNMCDAYLGNIKTLIQAHFRGAAKTTKTKLFLAFVIANDRREARKRYIKVLSEEGINSTQIVTDVYNMLINPRVRKYYPELFKKSYQKREETMSSFTTTTGVKMLASTVGKSQRGQLQGEDNTRPDFMLFDDFETSLTVQSLADTRTIWLNMEEAWNGRAKTGSAIYNCNYISKRRNVQRLVDRANRSPEIHRLHRVPIDTRKEVKDPVGEPTWKAQYTRSDIKQIEKDADDFAGEYLQMPSGDIDSYFAEEIIKKHPIVSPLLETRTGWTYLFKVNKKHNYLMGVDPAGGTGGNFATIVIIDLTLKMVVAFYRDRFTDPIRLGEIAVKQARIYNNAFIVPEINYQGFALLKVFKDEKYNNLYEDLLGENKNEKVGKNAYNEQNIRKMGFTTTATTKPLILADLRSSLKDFDLIVPSETLQKELIEFPREYVEMVKADDDELGHFDLTMALAIAWQGRSQVLSKLFTKQYEK